MKPRATFVVTALAAAVLAACGGGGARPSEAPKAQSGQRATKTQPAAAAPVQTQPADAPPKAPQASRKRTRKAAPRPVTAPASPGGVVVEGKNAASLVDRVLAQNRQQPRHPARTNGGALGQVLSSRDKPERKPTPAPKPPKGGSALALPGLSGSK